jgi:hypothetical protein
MKTRPKPSKRHEELKAKYDLSDPQFQQMLDMLEGLTPAERATLKDPNFITEDEADLIWIDREPDGPAWSRDDVLAEAGMPRRRRTA